MKTLFVAGNFDMDGGRPSGLAEKMASFMDNTDFFNGGHYEKLKELLESAGGYDCVLWFANVPNNLPKVRNIKEINKTAILVSSKRNDDGKYSFEELIRRALQSKSNLVLEFSRKGDVFNIRVFDPLGCVWYDGIDIKSAVDAVFGRINILCSITRCGTNKVETHPVKAEKEFVDVITAYSNEFYRLLKIPVANGIYDLDKSCRCARSMPSFKSDGRIYVSPRTVLTEHITEDDFLMAYEKEGQVFCGGGIKPSVDCPVHVKLYDCFPEIRYIIHSHCYIRGAEFTKKPLPCGALEEANEILDVIGSNKNLGFYAVNEIGHGSILMASSVNKLKAEYYARPIPEKLIYP